MAPKRILSRMSQYRWPIVVGLLVAQSFAIFALAVVSLSQSASNRSQNLDIRDAQTQRIVEQKAKKEAAFASCRAAIDGTALGNRILGEIRSAFEDLSVVATSPKVKEALIQHAKNLPVFPKPTCDPGTKKPKPKKGTTP